MKKKLISLFVCLAMLLPNVVFPVSAAVTVTHFDAKTSQREETFTNALSGLTIFECNFTHPTSNDVKSGIYFMRADRGTWPTPFMAITDKDGVSDFIYNANGPGKGSAQATSELIPGNTYSGVVVIGWGENTAAGKLKVYVDDTLMYEGENGNYADGGTDTTKQYKSLLIAPGTEVNLYADEDCTMEDFSYDDWTARLESSDSIVSVNNDTMVIDAGKEEMSAGELLSRLTLPEGASAIVTDGGEEVASDTALTNDMKVDVTLKWGNKISYSVENGFVLLTSDSFDVSVELDGNEVTSAQVSGVKEFTPCDEFLSSVVLGKDGGEIIGLEPSGDFVTDDMMLKVKTVDEEIVSFDIILSDSFTSFEEQGGINKIANLEGKLKGKEIIIKGTAEIPGEGLSESLELCFKTDSKNAYPIQFGTDGSISIYGNSAGSFANNSSYDYAIITNAEAGTASAYINGIKVLDEADITSQLTSDDDPLELVGGSYDPAQYGDFLLAEIHSAQSFEDFYTPSLAMLSDESSGIVISFDSEEGAVVNIYTEDGAVLSDLSGMIMAAGNGVIEYFDADGNEITSADSPASSVARIDVTSENGLYTNSYKALFPEGYIASSLYEVDEDKLTIGKLPYYTLAGSLTDDIKVARPDYIFDGIYRGNTKLESADALIRGDKLRISKGIEYRSYEIKFISDFVPGTPAEVFSFDIPTGDSPIATTAKKLDIDAEALMNEKGIKIFEYEFTYPEVPAGSKHLAGIYFNPLLMPAGAKTEDDGTANFIYETNNLGASGAKKTEPVEAGKTYKILLVLDVQENGISRLSTYVNGELKRDKVDSSYSVNSGITAVNAYPGTKGNIYIPGSQYYLDDFSYSDWTARLESGDSVVAVDNSLMQVDAGKAEMTAGELLSKLIIPDGASVKITENGEEAASDAILTTDMKIDVTLKFGNSVSYDVITGFIPLTSDIYDISVKLDGESVASAKISGIKAFTPAEAFIKAFTFGKDGAELIGLEPSGDFVTEDMKLKVKTIDGDTLSYDIDLMDSYNTFEYIGGGNKIRNLHGIFKGEKSVIKGTAKIPESGLSENIELYFEMDIKQAFPVQFNTDGSINVYGHKVGSFANNASYDYVIITDAAEGKASAYINGMKVLENADITSQLTKEDDPFDLVGGAYNPAENGVFLLNLIYSEESFEKANASDIAMLEGLDKSVETKYSAETGAEVNLFVDMSSTIAKLSESLCAIGGGKLLFFDLEGNEITSQEALVTNVEGIGVVSQSGLYTNRYMVFFPEEFIKSDVFDVDEGSKTVGGLVAYTPVSVLCDAITVVKPGFVLDGVWRGETKLSETAPLQEGDTLRLTDGAENISYSAEFIPDYVIEGGQINYESTADSVIVFEGSFTIPESGIVSYTPSIIWDGANTLSAVKFNAGSTLEVWNNAPIPLENGKTYSYSYLHDFTTASYHFYLNGVRLYADTIAQTGLNAEFDASRISTLLQEGMERVCRVYSKADYVYKNDLSISALSDKITITAGAKNVINVVSAECATVGDLLNEISFRSSFAKENAFVSGNGAVVSDMAAELITGMLLTVKAESGFSADYVINVEYAPVTSYVFDVEGSTITYEKGNLTYDDLARHLLLSEGTELVVKKANGEIVTSGNIENGMTAVAGGKTYTINLPNAQPVPEISIASIAADEIFRTDETYSKTITASGSGVTGITVYLDGEKYVLGTQAGSYSFSKDKLTSGRHEIYAVAEAGSVKTETEHFIFYAFEEETDRLRAALEPVVMEVNYLDSDGEAIPVSGTVSYDKVSMIELVFNKALSVESVTEENISLYLGDTKLETVLNYEEDTEAARYAVIISDFGSLSSSADYEIRISGELEDTKGNTAKDESKIIFRTSPKAFDVKSDFLVNESGQPVATLSGGDSVKAKVELTNTSLNKENGLVILAVFDGSRMVGYSITPFEVEEGTVNKTVTTNAVEIHENASDNLKTYRYIWDSDINNMSTLLTQAMLK